MFAAGRIRVCERETDPQLEIAAFMKQADGGPAVLFSNVKGHTMPVIGNLLSCKDNCEAAFGLDYRGIRDLVSRALGNPIAPTIVTKAPVMSMSSGRTSIQSVNSCVVPHRGG